MSAEEKAGVWFNLYVLFSLVWSDRALSTEPLKFMWWFYVSAALIATIGATVQFVVVLRYSIRRSRRV